MYNSNLPAGAQYDKSAPYNNENECRFEWEQTTRDIIQDEALCFISNNFVDDIMNGLTISTIIEKAIDEGLTTCDKETQEDFSTWAFTELYEFIEKEIENKLFRLRI